MCRLGLLNRPFQVYKVSYIADQTRLNIFNRSSQSIIGTIIIVPMV